MNTSVQAEFSQDLMNQWWQRCGSLALELDPAHRQIWLERISEVIRYYRLSLHSQEKDQKKLFATLCKLSLAKSRAELLTFMISGSIPMDQMQQVYSLESTLESAFE